MRYGTSPITGSGGMAGGVAKPECDKSVFSVIRSSQNLTAKLTVQRYFRYCYSSSKEGDHAGFVSFLIYK